MEIKNARFIVSNTDVAKCPNTEKPEYAFIGRSNVGKSSLINMLTNRKTLAKTSGKPGKTKLINHFLINEEWYLVDLPGYGYAKIGKSEKKKWNQFLRKYILLRKNLVCLFVLIDIRHTPQKIDLEFMEWLGNYQVPFAIIFTKTDKIRQNQIQEYIEKYRGKMLERWEFMPDLFTSSAQTREGKNEILLYIENINKQLVNKKKK